MPSENPNGRCKCGCGRKTSIAPFTSEPRGYVKGQPLHYIAGHQNRKSPVAFVVDPETGCWVWQLSCTSAGYGTKCHAGRRYQAHRFFYEQLVGPVQDGLEMDHLCCNRACVNPDHLEPVQPWVNKLRASDTPPSQNALKTHCIHGHPLDGVTRRGRYCKTCYYISHQKYRAKCRAMGLPVQ